MILRLQLDAKISADLAVVIIVVVDASKVATEVVKTHAMVHALVVVQNKRMLNLNSKIIMTREQFQGMSDEEAEKCKGKTITFRRETSKSLECRKITDLLHSDPMLRERLHLDKTTKYLGFQLDGKERLFFDAPIDNITIE